MAGNPVFLVDNVYNHYAYPGHVVSATEEPTGNEAWRVATGRRHSLDKWTATTTNSTCVVTVTCASTCTADMIAIDRGHNLAGESIVVRGSTNGTDYSTIASITVPSASATADIDDTNGVLTEEEAFLKRWTDTEYSWYQLQIPSMGAGLVPEIVGLWIGLSFETRIWDFPWTEDEGVPMATVVETEAGWQGTGHVTPRRQGTIGLRLRTDAEYTTARSDILKQFGYKRRPMWIVPEDSQGDRAVLAVPNGPISFRHDGAWPFRRTQFNWIEHEPKRD